MTRKLSTLLGREVWWCRNEAEADELKAQGIPAGDIYTEWERRLLWELRDNPVLIQKADETKGVLNGKMVGRS